MEKVVSEMTQKENDDMRAEYDFRTGVRGKHYQAMQKGYTVTIHQTDGSTLVQEVAPREGVVVLDRDVQE
jgi:hypothetical protein